MAPAAGKDESWASPRLGSKQLLSAVLEAVRKLLETSPIDPDRVYVTGQSMGGYGSWGAAATAPDLFAAAVPVCGGGNPADAARIAKVAIWAFHGDADKTVPVEQSRTMIEALKKAGVEPTYTEYAGVPHNSWDKAYAEDKMWEWMFAQKKAKKE
jgi:predicted peptidase